MIPEFNQLGLLPPGVHRATLDEFKGRFVRFDHSDRRYRVFEGLERLLNEVRGSEIVKRVLIAGSFVTAKPEPNDFDCVLVTAPSGKQHELRPFEYRLLSRRMARKIFGGDVLTAQDGSPGLEKLMAFFQSSREGQPMGIVEIQQ